MRFTQTLHDAAEATREYAKGVDRATAIRRLFAFWMAFTIVVSLVPPGVLYLGGPDVSPIGVASAERYSTTEASYDGVSFTMAVGEGGHSARGLFWNDNGTEFFVVASGTNDYLVEYHVPAKWNVSGATFQKRRSTSEITVPMGLAWKPDGTKLFIAGRDTGVVEYDVSNPWNISNVSSTNTLSLPGSLHANDVAFNDDGTKMYVATNTYIREYDLSTAYDTTTATFVQNSSDVGLGGFDFGDSGSKLIGTNGSATNVSDYTWSLSSSFDVSTLSFDDEFDNTETTYGQDVSWNNDGSKFYHLSASGTIYQYSTTDATVSGTVTYASNGTAVEGASITVNASSATDTTDASGAYSLALDNGTYEITATKGDSTNSITVTVSGSDLTGQDIVLSSETLTLDVPTQMFPNETAAYEVTLEGQDVTDNATVTSSDPTNLTVNEATNELEATSDTSFAGEITITAEHDGLTASRNVTVANLSASNVALMQNAADMTAAIWGDVQGPDGTRPGGTQLTMRVLFVALLIGAAIATHASGFAGIGGITLIVVMGWFMGWVSDGMALVTVFTGLFIGLNLAANIDYSVRK